MSLAALEHAVFIKQRAEKGAPFSSVYTRCLCALLLPATDWRASFPRLMMTIRHNHRWLKYEGACYTLLLLWEQQSATVAYLFIRIRRAWFNRWYRHRSCRIIMTLKEYLCFQPGLNNQNLLKRHMTCNFFKRNLPRKLFRSYKKKYWGWTWNNLFHRESKFAYLIRTNWLAISRTQMASKVNDNFCGIETNQRIV